MTESIWIPYSQRHIANGNIFDIGDPNGSEI